MLKAKNIFLRALEPEDLNFLMECENDVSNWQLSDTTIPFSKYTLKEYLKNCKQDIYEARQFRYLIEDNLTSSKLGLIDLYDFCPKNKRAGIGIVIHEQKNKNNGYGKEALSLLVNHVFEFLDLRQVYAEILDNNIAAISLFTSLGFKRTGAKMDWKFINGDFNDVGFYQLIKV